MKITAPIDNQETDAEARTFLNWQRTSLAMLAIAMIALKLISLNGSVLSLSICLFVFIAALTFNCANFFFFKKINTVFLLASSVILISLIGLLSIIELYRLSF